MEISKNSMENNTGILSMCFPQAFTASHLVFPALNKEDSTLGISSHKCAESQESCDPLWVVGENVAGILTDEASSEVVALLEAEGYQVRVVVLPASAVGAWHERNRVFFIGYSEQFGRERNDWRKSGQVDPYGYPGDIDPAGGRLQRDIRRTEPEIVTSERYKDAGDPDRSRKPQQKRDVGEVGRWYSHTGEHTEDTAGKRSQGGVNQSQKNILECISQTNGKLNGLRLHPIFVEWVMGYPIGWTDLKPSEMLSFLNSPR
jgi:site-specific DNA-cytosine methylase